jgi:O-acetyl-ADP-ribose deacetylase (regulator of RNase III)
MIRFRTGNLFDSDAEALVNTVNCVGIMGRGVALQFKNAYPENFKTYAAACERGVVQPGRMFVFDTGELTSPRWIINFPTKRHWRGKSRIEDIEAGLAALVSELRQRGIRSVAVPPLGAGLGGLDWSRVRPLIERAFANLPNVEVEVYEPHAQGEAVEMNRSTKVPAMTSGRAALVVLMRRYLAALLDPSISLLEVHKLMYFLQVAGEPLRLRYAKALYGPYAENLRHVLHEIEGHLVSGYADGGDAPDKQLSLVPGAVEDAEAFLAHHAQTHQRFDRVANLVEGFETAFGLELLSTVHWVMANQAPTTPEALEQAVYAWGERKRQFSPQQIRLAANELRQQGWLRAAGPESLE